MNLDSTITTNSSCKLCSFSYIKNDFFARFSGEFSLLEICTKDETRICQNATFPCLITLGKLLPQTRGLAKTTVIAIPQNQVV